MRKEILSLVILSGLSLQAEGLYTGLDFQAGSGKHELTIDDVVVSNSDSLSASSFGLHVGYEIIPNGSIELSYGALSLEDDDITKIGLDFLQKFPVSSALSPYVGLGVSTNSISDSNVETGLGARLRLGAYYEIIPNLDIGAEVNYNYISWESATDYLGREWELSSSYYGLGLNVNYKF